jgi:predicted DNA-binding transcriptional regulator AlpA
MNEDRLLTQREAAHLFGVTERSFFNWRKRNLVPEPSVLSPSGRAMWSESVLRGCIKTASPTGGEAA